MANHTPHSHIQQLPNHPTTKTETANTTQNNATPNKEHTKQHKMGYFYLLLTTHTKNHYLI